MLRAVERLEAAGIFNPGDIHHQYALRCTIYYVLEYGLAEFRTRYNEHNVPGPRGAPHPTHSTPTTPMWLPFLITSVPPILPAGGVPMRRRQNRTRPPSAPPTSLFDDSTDWASAYAARTGAAHHNEDHFVELYSLEVLRLMPQHSAVALPSNECGWKDVKLHGGARGEFHHIFAAALRASQARATADSIRASENACMVTRGSRGIGED